MSEIPREIASRPESAPEEREIQHIAEHVEELIFPTVERDDLDRVIDAKIFDGVRNGEERRAKLRAVHFNPDDLERLGERLQSEFAQFAKDERSISEEAHAAVLRVWYWGLLRSRRIPKDQDEVSRNALLVGLRGEISRMMRKVLFATLQESEEDQDEVFSLHEDVLRDGRLYPRGNDEEEALSFTSFVREFVQLKNDNPEILKMRQDGILARIDGDDIRDRYRLVVNIIDQEA